MARPRVSNVLRASCAVGLAAALLLSQAAGLAAAATALTGQVTGQVTLNGGPLGGASVLVRVMPALLTIHNDKDGTALPFVTVATATTDRQGRFALTPTGVPASALDAAGDANFIAWVSDGTQTVEWAFPLDMSPGAAGSGVNSALSTASSVSAVPGHVALRFDLGKDPGAGSASDPATGWQGIDSSQLTASGLLSQPSAPEGAVMSSAQVAAEVNPNVSCSYYPAAYKYSVPEAFANVWSWSGAPVKFIQTYGTSHTLGVGIGISKVVQMGTSVMQESHSSLTVTGLYDNEVFNEVNYRSVHTTCDPNTYWVPDSTAFFSYPILGYAKSAHPTGWSPCAVYSGGSTYYKSTATNITFSAGVNLAAGTGASGVTGTLSAQAGWNSSSEEEYTFNSPSYLCGSTAAGANPSPQVEAHAY